MFMKVTVPLITPVIFFNFIMQTTQAFQEFTGPYVITGGGPTYYTCGLHNKVEENHRGDQRHGDLHEHLPL